MKKKVGVGIVLFLVLCGTFYFLTGFYVIQPIGAIPEGITIWYFRVGKNLPFITSPDGFSLKEFGSVSLMNRLASGAAISDSIKNRIILRLPYMKFLYLISTGGKEYDR